MIATILLDVWYLTIWYCYISSVF